MRISKDTYFLSLAVLASMRGTCARRKVGAVLVNERGHVLATGYNGVASGLPHCINGGEARCVGADSPSGTNLDACEAIHAEANAIIQCKNLFDVDTVYCTAEPCTTCIKLIMSTSCKRVVFLDAYPGSKSQELCAKANIELVQISNKNDVSSALEHALKLFRDS